MISKSILQKQTNPWMNYERKRCRYTKYVSHRSCSLMDRSRHTTQCHYFKRQMGKAKSDYYTSIFL